MSWLGSFGVLPSPNHVLAKLAIFRGAEFSSHSPRATDSAAMFYYYFKPFTTPFPPPSSPPTPFSIWTPLVRQFHSPVLLTTSARHPVRSSLLLSPPFQNGPPTTPLTTPPSRLVPSGGDENFQTSRDRNRIVISRGSRPSAIRRPNSLFLLCPWADVSTSKVPVQLLLFFFPPNNIVPFLFTQVIDEKPNIYRDLYKENGYHETLKYPNAILILRIVISFKAIKRMNKK